MRCEAKGNSLLGRWDAISFYFIILLYGDTPYPPLRGPPSPQEKASRLTPMTQEVSMVSMAVVPSSLVVPLVFYTARGAPSLILPRRGRRDAGDDFASVVFHVKQKPSLVGKVVP